MADKSNFFEWVGKPNDQGPRIKGLPRKNGMPTIVPCTPSYLAPKVPAWPDGELPSGGVYAET